MKRLETLEARRRALLARCDQQRVEIAYHIAKVAPGTQLARWTNRAPRSGEGHSLAWLAAIASLIVMLRPPRRLISWLAWITGALSLVSRAARVLRLIAHLRALRSGFR
jgi:hypothetical protein